MSEKLKDAGLSTTDIESPLYSKENFPFYVRQEGNDEFSLLLIGEYKINVGSVSFFTLNQLIEIFANKVDRSEAGYE